MHWCVWVCVCYLEMSPQYHSASCREMLLLKLLGAAALEGLAGFGGSAAKIKQKSVNE